MTNYLPHKILAYQLYLFQLEEYDRSRFLHALFKKKLIPSASLRKDVVWTTKAKLLAIGSAMITLLISFSVAYIYQNFANLLAFSILLFLLTSYLLNILSFIFLILTSYLLAPFELYQRNKMVAKAKEKMKELKAKNKNLKVIGITGSFGKSTMKEVLATILQEKYKVVKTPENNNTPIGIARVILNKLKDDTGIFVVEMGEYVKGDVDALCQIAKPDISVITGINEAHLERYGTMQHAIDTKFEIVENTPEDGLVILNADDRLTVENFERFVGKRRVEWFSSKNDTRSNFEAGKIELNTKGTGLNFVLKEKDSDEKESFNTNFLASYIIGYIIAGMIIGKELDMNATQIKLATSQLKPVPHRLEANLNANDILIIDDTYNGNSDGIKEGIELLKRYTDRRKIYITPGLVETGSLTEEIHIEIGRQLANAADKVVLIRNSVTGYIERGLLENGFKDENIIWFTNAKETYTSLNTFVKPGDVVLMQNDWSDNYF